MYMNKMKLVHKIETRQHINELKLQPAGIKTHWKRAEQKLPVFSFYM